MNDVALHKTWCGTRDNLSGAINNHDIEQTTRTGERLRRRLPRVFSNQRTDINAARAAIGEHFIGRIRGAHALDKEASPPASCTRSASQFKSTSPRRECKSKRP